MSFACRRGSRRNRVLTGRRLGKVPGAAWVRACASPYTLVASGRSARHPGRARVVTAPAPSTWPHSHLPASRERLVTPWAHA